MLFHGTIQNNLQIFGDTPFPSKQTHILQENDETNDMTHHFQLSPILMTAERYSLAVIKVGDG